jgi:integrase
VAQNVHNGYLSCRFEWVLTVDADTSRRIAAYTPRIPQAQWARLGDTVRATVAAVAPQSPYEVWKLLHVITRLAVFAEETGLPCDPALWLRIETIDAFLLSGCTEQEGRTLQTYRSWLRRARETLVWIHRGEAAPPQMTASQDPSAPYDAVEYAGLRRWAETLTDQQRSNALALMALAAGCGLGPGELGAVRGTDIRTTYSGAAGVNAPGVGRLVVCRAAWEEVLTELAEAAGHRYMFRPNRQVTAAKNLVNGWTRMHPTPERLADLSARRLRSTWIVELLTRRIDPQVIASAAGMASAAALARYHQWVPALDEQAATRLLRGETA